jgi:uncharacterized protein (DUF927 family)
MQGAGIETHTDGSHWVFVEGSQTAVPLSQARKVEPKPCPKIGPVDVLRLILPPVGYLCCAWAPIDAAASRAKNKMTLGDFTHEFSQSFDDLHADIMRNDVFGRQVYHACASFKTTLNRKQENVAYLKAFWLDADVGPGKPYATRQDALDALWEFCQKVNVPVPLVIASGSGIQGYWALEEAIDPATWQPYADAFLRAFRKYGLNVDPLSANSACVLRTPGTHHRKAQALDHTAPAIEVTVLGDLEGPYKLEQFSHLLLIDDNEPAAKKTANDPPPAWSHPEASKLRFALDWLGNDNFDYDTWLKFGAAIHGLGWGDRGRDIWDEWSKLSAKYGEDKQDKTWKSFDLPYIGRRATVATIYKLAINNGWRPPRINTQPGKQPDEPDGYKMEENGLYIWNEKREKWEWICAPFTVTQRERSPDGKGWSRRLSWLHHDKRQQTYLVSDARLHSDPGELCGELAGNGLTISTSQHKNLISYINRKSSANRGTIVERTGWHEIAGRRCFVMPDMVIGGVDKVTLQGSTSRPYAVSGTIEEWQTHVAAKAIGHRYLTFMLSNGFVGPLIELLEMESGGVHPHGASSIGKTTGVRMAVTPWGSGADRGGFLKSWSATRNGLEGAAVDHADTLLALEELGIANPKELGSYVYSLASGLGKQRADRTGALRAPKTWRIWAISSGEVTLRALMAQGGQRVRAGQEIRIVDIRADQGDGVGVFNKTGPGFNPKTFADELKLATCQYFGTAGPAFVAKLLEQDRERIRQFWDKMRREIPEKAKLVSGAEQVMRVADKFSLIATAGALATEFEILPWPSGVAEAAAAGMLDRWVKSRGGAKDPQEVTAGIGQVRKFIAEHGNTRFEDRDHHAKSKTDGPRVTNRLGWFSGAGADQRWYVLPSTFKDTFCEGFDYTIVREALHDYGMLERDPDGKHWPQNERCDGRTQRVYVLTARILQEEGAD